MLVHCKISFIQILLCAPSTLPSNNNLCKPPALLIKCPKYSNFFPLLIDNSSNRGIQTVRRYMLRTENPAMTTPAWRRVRKNLHSAHPLKQFTRSELKRLGWFVYTAPPAARGWMANRASAWPISNLFLFAIFYELDEFFINYHNVHRHYVRNARTVQTE